jgi:hypothetical protein
MTKRTRRTHVPAFKAKVALQHTACKLGHLLLYKGRRDYSAGPHCLETGGAERPNLCL